MKHSSRANRATARRVCDQNIWLASIVLSPHLCANPRLLAAAACHLLHSSGFRLPKHACNPEDRTESVKRRKLAHLTLPSTAPAGDAKQQLQQAACTGDLQLLQQFCQCSRGLDVSTACGPHGRTALHAAAEAGCTKACRILLDLGADTYCADDNGASPLMLAAAGGHTDAVKVLLEAGADPFHVCAGGINPLLCAAGAGSAPCVELLLAEGVDADYANTELGGGEHALLLAAGCGGLAAAQLLLAAGARANRADKAGRTPLWLAARNGHALMVQLLLSQPGVKHIRSFGASSTTPLQQAQAAHHTTCVALLSAHLLQHQQHNQQQQSDQLQSSLQQHPKKQHQQAKALQQAANKKPRQQQHKQAGLSPAGRRARAPGFSAVHDQHVDRSATVVC